MKPIIGIVARVEYPGETHKLVIEEEYRMAIIKHGGIPLCICPCGNIDYTTTRFSNQEELTDEEKKMLIEQIKLCNGLLLPGGFKINKFDRFIAQYAIENDIPMLGICLGMQVIASYGRELWNEKNNSFINHKVKGLAHNITIDKSSKLFSIIKTDKIMVNSRHLYHVLPNDYFAISSVSDDNYIESIEIKDKKFIIGVQWHPESMNDPYSTKLFKAFLNASE